QGSVINKKFVSAEGPICSDLRAVGALLAASDDFAHSYPHSWRSKAKVIFRATPQWFIPMDQELPSRLREGLGEGMFGDVPRFESPSPNPSRKREGNIKRRLAEASGRRGERLAGWWLRLKGWRILARRVRTPAGEVDLIAKKGTL
uniref:YraN family protein n=1 Tax=Pseudomonas sp. JAI120 TaxID=2723063 RepID=UPI0030EBBFD2